MKTHTIGIDNGTSGSWAIVGPGVALTTGTPTKDAVLNRAGKMGKRVDVVECIQWVKNAIPTEHPGHLARIHAYVERPFTGSAMMINTTVLAARAFEATIIALEHLGIGYEVVDSRQWQSVMLPGIKGREDLKKASKAKGIQLYPSLAKYINQIGDADGLLIATWGSKL